MITQKMIDGIKICIQNIGSCSENLEKIKFLKDKIGRHNGFLISIDIDVTDENSLYVTGDYASYMISLLDQMEEDYTEGITKRINKIKNLIDQIEGKI